VLQCVRDLSTMGGLTPGERTCVTQCTARYVNSMDFIFKHFQQPPKTKKK